MPTTTERKERLIAARKRLAEIDNEEKRERLAEIEVEENEERDAELNRKDLLTARLAEIEREEAEEGRVEKLDKLKPLTDLLGGIKTGLIDPIARIPEETNIEIGKAIEGFKGSFESFGKEDPGFLSKLVSEKLGPGLGAAVDPIEDVGRLGLEGLNTLFSPFRGASKAFVGDPLKVGAKALTEPLPGETRSPEVENAIDFTQQVGTFAFEMGVPTKYFTAVLGATPELNALNRLGVAKDSPFKFEKAPLVLEDTPTSIKNSFSKFENVVETAKRNGVEKERIANLTGFDKLEAVVAQTRKDLHPKIDIHFNKAEGTFMTERVSKNITDNVVDAASTVLRGETLKGKRLFEEIAERLGLGEINVADLPEILRKNNMDEVDFAREFTDTISKSGRILGSLSGLSKKLAKEFESNPEVAAIFNSFNKDEKLIDKALRGISHVENVRRGFLVSQIATAMRNAESQAGRISINSFDQALEGLMTGGVGKSTMVDEVFSGGNDIMALFGKMSKKKTARVMKLLDDERTGLAKSRLLSQPIHEVTLGSKVATVVNSFNRAQELFFRKLAFEAKMRQLLKREGLSYATVDPRKIPKNLYDEAVDHALEMTFAASPPAKSIFGSLVNGWKQIPGLTLIQPFPRFAFANAPKFILEHSPLGYLEAMAPSTLRALASGNPAKFAKAASRASSGTMMFASAWHLRNSKFAGEKWYEIRIGDKTIDTRPFAPFSTYLLMAEMMVNPSNVSAADIVQGTVGISRVGGSGLMMLDTIKPNSTPEKNAEIMKRIAGQYLGSFSVPALSAKDLLAGFDPEEAIKRDARDNPVTGPFIKNWPLAGKFLLPEKVSTLDIKRSKTDRPVLRQFTGLNIKDKNILEKEVDRLAGIGATGDESKTPQNILTFRNIFPSTGIPKADRIVAANMKPFIVKEIIPLLRSEEYKKLNDTQKALKLKMEFDIAKRIGLAHLINEESELALGLRAEKIGTIEKTILEELGVTFKDQEETGNIFNQLKKIGGVKRAKEKGGSNILDQLNQVPKILP